MTDNATHIADPEVVVGSYIRRLDNSRAGLRGRWGHIAMTVPSPLGPCWLVCFIDGDLDVWRADDPSAHYEFHPSRGAQP